MNAEPSWRDGERIWSRMRPLLDELLSAPRSPRVAGAVPAIPGIYLFSDVSTSYVGRLVTCATAWRSHAPSGRLLRDPRLSRYVMRAQDCGLATGVRARKDCKPTQFVPYFAGPRRVASWDVAVSPRRDPPERTVFECTHAVLGTDLNSSNPLRRSRRAFPQRRYAPWFVVRFARPLRDGARGEQFGEPIEEGRLPESGGRCAPARAMGHPRGVPPRRARRPACAREPRLNRRVSAVFHHPERTSHAAFVRSVVRR